MPVFYSLVARDKVVLVDYATNPGNFLNVAMKILQTMDMSKIFGRFVTNDYSFLTYVKDGLVFLVMVEAGYEDRIAASFLKTLQQKFQEQFDIAVRSTAGEHSLNEFHPTMKEWMAKYSNKESVDKLSKLKKQLQELEAHVKLKMEQKQQTQ